MRRFVKAGLICLFAVYMALLLRLTVFRQETFAAHAYNFVPFVHLIRLYWTDSPFEFYRQFFGNIGWFVPLGFLLPLCTKMRQGKRVCLAGFLVSLCIELAQLCFKKGVCELDDVVLNTAGVMIGYWLYRYIRKALQKRKQK